MIFLPLVANKTAFQIVDLVTPKLKLDDLAAARLLCLLTCSANKYICVQWFS